MLVQLKNGQQRIEEVWCKWSENLKVGIQGKVLTMEEKDEEMQEALSISSTLKLNHFPCSEKLMRLSFKNLSRIHLKF